MLICRLNVVFLFLYFFHQLIHQNKCVNAMQPFMHRPDGLNLHKNENIIKSCFQTTFPTDCFSKLNIKMREKNTNIDNLKANMFQQ